MKGEGFRSLPVAHAAVGSSGGGGSPRQTIKSLFAKVGWQPRASSCGPCQLNGLVQSMVAGESARVRDSAGAHLNGWQWTSCWLGAHLCLLQVVQRRGTSMQSAVAGSTQRHTAGSCMTDDGSIDEEVTAVQQQHGMLPRAPSPSSMSQTPTSSAPGSRVRAVSPMSSPGVRTLSQRCMHVRSWGHQEAAEMHAP